ncbi:MAG: hypothetical protein K2N38_05210 [Oscillospiraceae bacterium]|nr:hypothetical protein [Oscillospiraceae bacterium]
MENKYKELFDKITPRMSDDELLSAVLDRKAENMGNSNEKKRFAKKAVIIPAVAAAALLCTTVGVAAAYEWNIPAAISDIFNMNSDKIPDSVSFKEFNFTTVGGRELDDVLKFDGYEVQMKGVAADPHSMLLFYDLVVDDANALDDESMEKISAMYSELDLSLFVDYNRRPNAAGTPDDPVFSQEWSWKHINIGTIDHNLYLGSEGNIAHFCLKHAVLGASLAGKNVTIEAGGLGKGDDGSLAYNGSERAEYVVDLDFVDDSSCIDIMVDNEITLSEGIKGKVTHIQLTPFSVCFRVDWGEQPVETPDENGNISESALNRDTIYNEFKLKLKDGTIMDADAFRSFEDGADRSYYKEGYTDRDENGVVISSREIYAQDPIFEWLYPVNVEDVEALIIGTTTVPINQ